MRNQMLNHRVSQEVRVGVLDSGFSPELEENVEKACAFCWQQGGVQIAPAQYDQLGHGSAMMKTIQQVAPHVKFLVAQVFHDRWVTTPAQVATALDWLVEQGVQVVNLSLGLKAEREVLRSACERAIKRGVVLVAASPALGAAVYPSAYPGVIRATGDARCDVQEISFLDSSQADFGACVRSPVEGIAGASVGTAYLTGHIARYLNKGGGEQQTDICQGLLQQVDYWGVEKRFG
jgi:Subtilase family